MRLSAFAFAVTVLVACGSSQSGGSGGGSGGAGGGTGGNNVARIDVPEAALLDGTSATRVLEASAFDSSGAKVNAALTWESSAPDVASVDTNGTVSAHKVGTAEVRAKAGAVSSKPVLVAVVKTKTGVVLVPDSDVVEAVKPVDAAVAPEVGAKFSVLLATAPQVGQLLLASGNARLAGKVVSVTPENGKSRVVFELVPVDEVFAEISYARKFKREELLVNPRVELESDFDVVVDADGTEHFTLKSGKTLSGQAKQPLSVDFKVGSFKCTAEAGFDVSVAKFDFAFQPAIDVDVALDGTNRRIVVTGSPSATFDVRPRLAGGAVGKVDCRAIVKDYVIPVPGPVGIFLGAAIPMGVGFEAEVKASLTSFGVDLSGNLGANMELGFRCASGACTLAKKFERFGDSKAVWVPPMLAPKVAVSGTPYVFAELEGGARMSTTIRLEAVQGKAGVTLAGSLASEDVQATDEAFAAAYSLEAFATVGPAFHLEGLLKLIGGIAADKLTVEARTTLGTSPSGALTRDLKTFAAGDQVTFTLNFDPASIVFPLVPYNVKKVRVYRLTAANALILANEAVPSPNAAKVTIPWVATVDSAQAGTFVAFAYSELMPDLALEQATGGREPAFRLFGYSRASFLIRDDGSLWSWGEDELLLGRKGAGFPRFVPAPVIRGDGPAPRLLKPTVAVAAGLSQAFAVLENGTLWSWRQTLSGAMCGLSDGGSPGDVASRFELNDVTDLSAGPYHALFLVKDGGVQGCGSNLFGSMGPTAPARVDKGFVQVPFSNVKQLAVDGAYSAALLNNGDVMFMGRLEPVDAPTPILLISGAKRLRAERSVLFVVTNDDKLHAWGQFNALGRLPDGGAFYYDGGVVTTNVRDIRADTETAAVLKLDDSVETFGHRQFVGQGLPTIGPTTVPPATILTGVSEVGRGLTGAEALLKDGGVVTWGGNIDWIDGGIQRTPVPIFFNPAFIPDGG